MKQEAPMTSFTPLRAAQALLLLTAVLASPLSGADPEKARKKLDKEGLAFTPEKFHLKVFLNDPKIVELFLEAGMSPDTADPKGEIPIVTAARQEDGKVVAILLKAGANPNLANPRGTTALCRAAGDDAMKNVKALLSAGAAVNTVCGFGRTALHEAAEDGNGPIVSALVAAGAELEARDDYSQTPLYFASKAAKPDATKILLAAGADPNAKLKSGRTLLHQAVEWNKPDLVRMLVEGGASIDLKDAEGQTALHMAAAQEKMQIIPVLLELGADPEVKNRKGETAVQHAVSSHSPDAAKLLQGVKKANVPARAGTAAAAKGAPSGDPKADLKKMGFAFDEETFWGRLEAEDTRAITLFLKGGMSPQIRNNLGRTPLYVAVDGGKTAAVQTLLDNGADPNDAGKGHPSMDFGESLALKAVDQDDPEILRALIVKGTDVNKGNQYGAVPLHEASRQGKLKMVQMLVEAKANPNARAGGAPVLHGPVMEDRIEVVRYLLKSGAKVGNDRKLLLGAAKSAEMKSLLQGAK
jgi:ankyrin repeat protein